MKLCACNGCGKLYEDTNPQTNSPEYPDEIPVQSLQMFYVVVSEPETGYWGCPECCTDGMLTDDIENHVEQNRLLLQAARIYCEQKIEYQEEHTTGWDRLQNLIALIDK